MLTKERYESIRSKVLLNLETNLPPDLLYHCVAHTVDVEQQAERIAIQEGVGEEQDLLLLKIACLYHDTGFLFTYLREHEAAGCNFARTDLADADLSPEQLDSICGMIMATRIPQTPHTPLEEIICDADLDYLGREDFLPVSNNLFLELKARGIVTTEEQWNNIQLQFFNQHRYFTETTKALREDQKQQHLKMIAASTQQV